MVELQSCIFDGNLIVFGASKRKERKQIGIQSWNC
jgi:hypothetical protein